VGWLIEDAKQAHEDAKKLLAAMASKAAEDGKWEPIFNRFIEITKACIGVAVCCDPSVGIQTTIAKVNLTESEPYRHQVRRRLEGCEPQCIKRLYSSCGAVSCSSKAQI
jgi:hypothetical protein